MSSHPATRIKICCISSFGEARRAAQAGADVLGLVSAMPSGPGPIDDDLIYELTFAAKAWPEVRTFVLTAETDADALAHQHVELGGDTFQLVAATTPETRRALREFRPELGIVQVVHVEGEESLEMAREAALHSDAVLLDSGRPAADVPELGGTGRTHDWALSRRITEALDVPVWLAGGLNPDNVAEAIAEVQPYGVDVCSGLRTEGRLDPERMAAFLAAVRSA